MKVILTSDVDRLGRAGEVVSVTPGYARNFLLPRKFAYEATPENVKRAEWEKKKAERAKVQEKKDAEGMVSVLEQVSLTIRKQAGENDRLFGSVTAMDVAEALAQEGHEVDKRKIVLEEPIKTIGIYTVPVKLHHDVTARLKVWVVKE